MGKQDVLLACHEACEGSKVQDSVHMHQGTHGLLTQMLPGTGLPTVHGLVDLTTLQ